MEVFCKIIDTDTTQVLVDVNLSGQGDPEIVISCMLPFGKVSVTSTMDPEISTEEHTKTFNSFNKEDADSFIEHIREEYSEYFEEGKKQ